MGSFCEFSVLKLFNAVLLVWFIKGARVFVVMFTLAVTGTAVNFLPHLAFFAHVDVLNTELIFHNNVDMTYIL